MKKDVYGVNFILTGRIICTVLHCSLVFILFIQISCSLTKPEVSISDHYTGPAPLAVLIERDPWLLVIGSDTPIFALYDDGTVIYLKKHEKKPSFYVKKILDQMSLEKLRKRFPTAEEFMKLDNFYNLSTITDLFTVEIYVSDGDLSKAISIYGMIPETTGHPAMWVPDEFQKPDRLPGEIRMIYNEMTNISYCDAEVWIPAYIEVMIWTYRYESDELLIWPENLPSFNDPLTRKRSRDSYSLYIPGTKFDDLRIFLSKRKQGQAVLIDGKKWSVSYRFVFPGESVWQNAFRKNKQD